MILLVAFLRLLSQYFHSVLNAKDNSAFNIYYRKVLVHMSGHSDTAP